MKRIVRVAKKERAIAVAPIKGEHVLIINCLVARDPKPEGSYLMNLGGAQRRKAAEEVDKTVVYLLQFEYLYQELN